jgi:hypothetical protein
MLRPALICLLIALVALTLPGCSMITGESIGGPVGQEITMNTEFGRMLGFVPYSFLEEHDLWFGNPGELKALYGLDDIHSIREFMDLPEETRKQVGGFLSETGISGLPITRYPEIYDLVGFDIMSVDRALYGNVIPPRGFYILEGYFDEALIGQKLTGLGYTRIDYGSYSYYGIGDDFQINMKNPLGRLVLAAMNRMAVFDGTVIFSPVTADVTGVFDAMSGDTPSVMDNAVCRALADSLGDVLMATLTTPERIIYSDLTAEEDRPVMFDFTIPADWGTLQGYEMAALGYRMEGEKRFFDIALYYKDKSNARADGQEIVKRMQTYKMGTYMGGMKKPDDSFMFTESWQPGEPVVTACGDGFVLKITCYPTSGVPRWISMLIGSSGIPFRDVLFLAPDPSEYIGKNE